MNMGRPPCPVWTTHDFTGFLWAVRQDAKNEILANWYSDAKSSPPVSAAWRSGVLAFWHVNALRQLRLRPHS